VPGAALGSGVGAGARPMYRPRRHSEVLFRGPPPSPATAAVPAQLAATVTPAPAYPSGDTCAVISAPDAAAPGGSAAATASLPQAECGLEATVALLTARVAQLQEANAAVLHQLRVVSEALVCTRPGVGRGPVEHGALGAQGALGMAQ
jgi:hypothetical protein